jgi:hypothetical protein
MLSYFRKRKLVGIMNCPIGLEIETVLFILEIWKPP